MALQFARSIALQREHEVAAITSRTMASAERMQAVLGVSRVHKSYQALLDDPAVDAIYIATPPVVHCEQVLLALEARKPVLCEKPFAIDATEAQEMSSAAQKMGVFCMEAMWMRFIPAIQALRTRMNAGEIGDPKLLAAELGFPFPYSDLASGGTNRGGDGALLDLGVYPLSLAWFLFGRPHMGQALFSENPQGTDTQAVISLAFASGALATLSCSFTQRLRNTAFIAGDTGSLMLDAPLYAPSRIIHTRGAPYARVKRGRLGGFVDAHPQLVTLRRRYAPILRKLLRREQRTSDLSFPGYGYQFQASEVERCVHNGNTESSVMPLDESVEIISAIDALRSAGGFDWRACGSSPS